MNKSRPAIPMAQQFTIIQQAPIVPDSTIILTSEMTQMVTEDIPEIDTSSSKTTIDNSKSGKKSQRFWKAKSSTSGKQKDNQIGQSKPSAVNNNKSKSHEKSRTKVIKKVIIPQVTVTPDEKLYSIQDILIYNIPVQWSKEDILNHLTAWASRLLCRSNSYRNTKWLNYV
ncbi:hypothetical protein RclHR1_01450011 [Rhizophagus clarus]|nr:hypothetical protein RclHR1_01450011 [Rhizophagus clarus]